MLETLKKAFETSHIRSSSGNTFVKLHSNTSKEQGLFLQELFDIVIPKKSLEVGLAYGISALFILEKHKEYKSSPKSHIVIEPFSWDGVAEYNIEKEQLTDLVEYIYRKSIDVLPGLYMRGERIQFAYVDTTKVFDTVLLDFHFIDKILDVDGIIILDDCNGGWPGVQRVARFINTLPHYTVSESLIKVNYLLKGKLFQKLSA